MSQQINLYQPILLKQHKLFSARAMLQAVAVVVLGICAVYGYSYWQLAQLRSALVQANRQHERAARQLAEVSQRLAREADPRLVAELERTGALVNGTERLLAALEGSQFGNVRGFSGYFIALARQHQPGLWLTRIEIDGAGHRVRLDGGVTAPTLLPRYIQRLAGEPGMRGVQFGEFTMTRPGESEDEKAVPVVSVPHIVFRVASVAPEQAGEEK